MSVSVSSKVQRRRMCSNQSEQFPWSGLGLRLASASSTGTFRGSVSVSVRFRVRVRDRVKGLCEFQGQSETVSM